jgi:hypothetical protein
MNATEIAEMFGYNAGDPDATDKILEDIHCRNAKPPKGKSLPRFIGGPSGLKCTFEKIQQDYALTNAEIAELKKYTEIFIVNNFEVHHAVNQFISKNNRWADFPCMRSLNDHGDNKDIPGILPKYFMIVCILLGVSGDGGTPLDEAKKY